MQSDSGNSSNCILFGMLRQERKLGQAAIRKFRWPDSIRTVVLGQG